MAGGLRRHHQLDHASLGRKSRRGVGPIKGQDELFSRARLTDPRAHHPPDQARESTLPIVMAMVGTSA